jgi:hypothetical protein
MNDTRNLLRRLLKLYPVKVVKHHFDPENSGQADMIAEIVANNTEATIKAFAYSNHNYTKQHIFLYRLNQQFNINTFNRRDFPFEIVNETITDGGYRFKLLPLVDFNVVIKAVDYEDATIKFIQPVTVYVKNHDLIIQTTIMEKNISSYFPANQRVIDVKKENSEDFIIGQLLNYWNNQNIVNQNDINRGVKHLWENNLIDSKFAKWKKDRSTTTESMDEEYTLKDQYPDVYQNLMRSPLNKTVFKYKGDDDDFPKHFTADPSDGTLNFATYPETQNQIENVISKILSNN